MFIPKIKMPDFIKTVEFILAASDGSQGSPIDLKLSEEEKEMWRQIHDRATLCMHGDANFLEVEVFYGTSAPK